MTGTATFPDQRTWLYCQIQDVLGWPSDDKQTQIDRQNRAIVVLKNNGLISPESIDDADVLPTLKSFLEKSIDSVDRPTSMLFEWLDGDFNLDFEDPSDDIIDLYESVIAKSSDEDVRIAIADFFKSKGISESSQLSTIDSCEITGIMNAQIGTKFNYQNLAECFEQVGINNPNKLTIDEIIRQASTLLAVKGKTSKEHKASVLALANSALNSEFKNYTEAKKGLTSWLKKAIKKSGSAEVPKAKEKLKAPVKPKPEPRNAEATPQVWKPRLRSAFGEQAMIDSVISMGKWDQARTDAMNKVIQFHKEDETLRPQSELQAESLKILESMWINEAQAKALQWLKSYFENQNDPTTEPPSFVDALTISQDLHLPSEIATNDGFAEVLSAFESGIDSWSGLDLPTPGAEEVAQGQRSVLESEVIAMAQAEAKLMPDKVDASQKVRDKTKLFRESIDEIKEALDKPGSDLLSLCMNLCQNDTSREKAKKQYSEIAKRLRGYERRRREAAAKITEEFPLYPKG